MNGPRFIDTNVLLYSISRDPLEAHKREIAIALLDTENIALSVQVLQEFDVQATSATRSDALAHEIAVGLGAPGSASGAGDNATSHDQRVRNQGDLRAILWDAAIVAKVLPFEPLAPNAETIEAMKAARCGDLVVAGAPDKLLGKLNAGE